MRIQIQIPDEYVKRMMHLVAATADIDISECIAETPKYTEPLDITDMIKQDDDNGRKYLMTVAGIAAYAIYNDKYDRR